MKDEVDFLPADKRQSFNQVDTIILGVCGQAQIIQNKFAVCLQYFKKEVSDAVDFMLADRDESFPQIDTMIFDEDGQAFSQFPK